MIAMVERRRSPPSLPRFSRNCRAFRVSVRWPPFIRYLCLADGSPFFLSPKECQIRGGRSESGQSCGWPALAMQRPWGLRLVEGRFLQETDTIGAPDVAVVNSTFVQRIFAGRSPIGLRFTMDRVVDGEEVEWTTVVGVVDDVRHVDLTDAGDAEIYLSTLQHPFEWATIALRADGEPGSLAGPAQTVFRRLDPDLPVFNIQTMDEIVTRSMGWPRSTLVLVGTFAILALALAAIGIYGVLSFSVSRRTRELGIRIALGAQRTAVLRLVVRQGLVPVTVGIGLGLAGVLGLRQLLESQLYGVGTTDPAALAGASAVLLLAGLAACLFPAWRATRIDPMTALRTE